VIKGNIVIYSCNLRLRSGTLVVALVGSSSFLHLSLIVVFLSILLIVSSCCTKCFSTV